MNILIVESENDQYFVQALLNHEKIKNSTVWSIDKFEYQSFKEGNPKELAIKIGSAFTTTGIQKLGIIFDIDQATVDERIQYINVAIKIALTEQDFKTEQQPILTKPNDFIVLQTDDYSTVKVACYFTNVDGKGELEDVLKKIALQPSPFADCLEAWVLCFTQKGKKLAGAGQSGDIKEKELTKLWVEMYKRLDTIPKTNDRNDRKTNWEGVWLGYKNPKGDWVEERGSKIFNLEDESLKELKNFLAFFGE
jgi:hypothetical protein